ncbi:uncharacterized protein V1513DRAFT_374140 [Lipomyces chichibuensis]|uniref:uncharacterized protein n=1 Tax=Lipomyces chichibuensis TaxID=1546026 RepID=UPI003344006C
MQYLPDNIVSLLRSEVTIASVHQCVAELVHNSLDAKASHIDIILRLSPFYMLVKDDGHGITPDDMRHIGRRHFTSKCRELRDLESIRSFGFRGEALAGIAAISQLTVSSRHSDYRSTNTVTIMNSKEIYNKPSTTSLASHGTHVVVQDLFNNLPVRRRNILGDSENNKSSRDDIVKSVKICLVDVALSLVSEAVNIRFRSDSGLVLNLSVRPDDDACAILTAAYGRSIFKAFDTLSAKQGDVTITGLVSRDLTSTKNYQYIFINRRKLVASGIYKSLSDLFAKYLYFREESSVGNQHRNDLSTTCTANMHPIFVVHVIAPLSGYDLCQDPGKVLVDLENYGDIETTILDSVRNSLSRLHKLPDPYAQRLDADVQIIYPNWESPVFDTAERSVPRLSLEYQAGDLHLSSRKLTKSALQEARFISQINKEFILLTIAEDVGESTLVMVDQHAADERIRLEMLLVDYFAQVLRVQTHEKWSSSSRPGDNDDADFSVKLKCDFSVSQEDFEALAEWQLQLELWGVRYNLGTLTDRPSKAGMATKDLDEDELSVHVTHCPVILIDRYMEEPALVKEFLLQHVYDLQSGDVTKLVASQICDIINNGHTESAEVLLDLAYRHIPRVIVDLMNSKACRGAIMFGDSLSEDRSRKLIHDLSNCRFPFQCAHGRPSIVPLVDL